MDIKRKRIEDISRTADMVVRLQAKPRFATGAIPMTDVLVSTPKMVRRTVRFALGMSSRMVALSLALLMVLLPMSPVFAEELDDGIDVELSTSINQETINDEAESLFTENEEEQVIDDAIVVDGADEEPVVTTSSVSSGDETDEISFDEAILPSEEGEEEVQLPVSSDEGAEVGDVDNTDNVDDTVEVTEEGDGLNEDATEFDPNKLPSADNVPPDGWYDDGAEGDVTVSGEEPAGDEDVTEDDVIEPPTEEELYEQLRAEVYEEVISELSAQIDAFNEEKQRLKEGCLNYEDGSFFCLNPEREGGPVSAQAGGGGTVYAQQDEVEGDGEIWFLADDADSPLQITNDTADDQFPSIDLAGRAMVWQSFVNDRWQIRYRDMETGVVEQLTSATHNSMNPAVSGDIVVWQAWPKDNWEIFMARRQAGGWSVEILTQTVEHDMFPKVAGGFVTWQSNDGDNWQVYAYEIATGTTTKLSTGTSKQENPRVALIWESTESDGSRRIFGLDLSTGVVEPIGNRPATPDPAELPQPPLTDEEVTMPTEPRAEDEAPISDSAGNGNGDL